MWQGWWQGVGACGRGQSMCEVRASYTGIDLDGSYVRSSTTTLVDTVDSVYSYIHQFTVSRTSHSPIAEA